MSEITPLRLSKKKDQKLWKLSALGTTPLGQASPCKKKSFLLYSFFIHIFYVLYIHYTTIWFTECYCYFTFQYQTDLIPGPSQSWVFRFTNYYYIEMLYYGDHYFEYLSNLSEAFIYCTVLMVKPLDTENWTNRSCCWWSYKGNYFANRSWKSNAGSGRQGEDPVENSSVGANTGGVYTELVRWGWYTNNKYWGVSCW